MVSIFDPGQGTLRNYYYYTIISLTNQRGTKF
jgi:hypothetical protein